MGLPLPLYSVPLLSAPLLLPGLMRGRSGGSRGAAAAGKRAEEEKRRRRRRRKGVARESAQGRGGGRGGEPAFAENGWSRKVRRKEIEGPKPTHGGSMHGRRSDPSPLDVSLPLFSAELHAYVLRCTATQGDVLVGMVITNSSSSSSA